MGFRFDLDKIKALPNFSKEDSKELRESYERDAKSENGLVKEKLTEKQKNCQYCHEPYIKIPVIKGAYGYDDAYKRLFIYPDDPARVVFEGIYGEPYPRSTDERKVQQLCISLIYYCPMCGRPLNEEEE